MEDSSCSSSDSDCSSSTREGWQSGLLHRIANAESSNRDRRFESCPFLQLEGAVKVANWFRTPGALR